MCKFEMEDKDKLACRLARIICTLMIWLEGEWELDDKFAAFSACQRSHPCPFVANNQSRLEKGHIFY
jgi:hypothetical protein